MGGPGTVLGGALYSNRWHRDTVRFARRHARALRGLPVWLFSSGPLDTSADERDIAPVAGAAEAAQRLGARGHVTFGGRLTAEATGFIARAMVRNGRGGDFRNPERIAVWARTWRHSCGRARSADATMALAVGPVTPGTRRPADVGSCR